MLKIDPQSRKLLSTGGGKLRSAPLGERYQLRELVANSPQEFLKEANSRLLPLATSLAVADGASRRIDLVAANAEGRVYTGLVGDHEHEADLIEALEAASITATWGWRGLLRRLNADLAVELEEFLEAPIDRLNREQGVLLISENFGAETLESAAWLRNRYRVDIVCLQAALAIDSANGEEFVVCRNVSDEPAMEAETWSEARPTPAPEEKQTAESALEQWESELSGYAKVEPKPAPPPPSPAPPTPHAKSAPPPPAPEPEVEESSEEEAPIFLPDPQQEEFEATTLANLAPEDDPLAPFLDPQASLLAEERPDEDRRGAGRSDEYQARRLRLDYYGRLLGARLVDFSKKGLGVEALSPLPVGSEVGISGEFIGEEGAMAIEGRARVTHCSSRDDGVCRIGFSLADASLKKVDPGEAFGRR